MVPKKSFGKEYIGVERSTFIFNKEGELVKEFRGVKVDGHGEEVLDFIKEI
jgi:peroxiredoxin Q/BCP